MTHVLLGAILLAAQIPLQRIGPYMLIEGVRVNGAGPFRFLVDTGAQSCLISDEVARRAGILPASRVELERATGAVATVPAAHARTLTVAGIDQHDVEVLFGSALDQVRRLDPHIDGVVGQSFLRRLDSYLIDNTRNLFQLNADPPARGTPLPLAFEADRPRIHVKGRPWILDSGSPHSDSTRGLLATAGFDSVYVSNRHRIAITQDRR